MDPVTLFVDAHVHLHPVFGLRAFLAAAARHVGRAAGELHPALSDAIGVLLLAEGPREGAFDRLRAACASGEGAWTVHGTREPESLLVRESGALRLVAIAGRQIVTAEGVEVLALLSAGSFADGAPLAETIALVRQSGAVPVLPWGFGKWTLRRGALVASLLRSGGERLFLGDNGGRLALAPTPSLLSEARQRGVIILPGSDPLPFPDQEWRAGSFGFLIDAPLDTERPAAGLRASLRDLHTQPRTYGTLERMPAFARNQLRMQWRKRVVRLR